MSDSAVHPRTFRRSVSRFLFALAVLAPSLAATPGVLEAQATCSNTVTADVVALDQPIFYNRLGAFDPAAMIYALRRDVVSKDGTGLTPGNVELRDGKRPRPLVLRVNEGDCIEIQFENLLAPQKVDDEQPATRTASIHVVGMQLVTSITDDGSNVGKNDPGGTSGLVDTGESIVYTYFAQREGGHLFYSAAATTGGEGDGGSIPRGLFGSINVEPPGAEWYRSQLTEAEMELATVATVPADTAANGDPIGGQPILDYDAVYPVGHPFAGLPIIRMTQGSEIVHSDLNAIITGPNRQFFPDGTFPKDTILEPREQPFREFTVIFHDEIGIVQAFDIFEDPEFEFTLHSGRDAFAINYGTAGIGAEILGNRFGVGPMGDCNECKYEEFFLSSWAVGDPAMPVDIPANVDVDGDSILEPGPKATKALFPADPSNVHHSYINDHVKFRNMHAGPKEHHIFHLHAHQWVATPDADVSTYLDSQAIGPGSTYTYEIAYDGGGNRPKTPGDAIFHCHFYPHFAQGMWELWRVHDVFEAGTELDADGVPVPGARALPDGEIEAGTPIPAVVPIPGLAMAPMPTPEFPGYPFYIPGIGGHRAPHPPLDTEFDGGLPRHVVQGGEAEFPEVNTLDFSKENITLDAVQLPETGTPEELAAMAFHAQRMHESFVQPIDGTAAADGAFITNGLPPAAGAPYADPCIDDFGNAIGDTITYLAADIQLDVKYNKKGWHHPQHRMTALWGDVAAFKSGAKPPEPLFFRANTNDCIVYKLTNLIPFEYQLDDFQVLTPTDVVGQHIHLVKFDVTSSDGAANGFNYEDGSFSPDEVIERIEAIRAFNQCLAADPRNGTFECPEPEQHPFFDGPRGLGAQTTVQRWFADDVLNNEGNDRTLRTVFTHDHMSPSTHQQVGLYAGLVVEPEGSEWFHNETGVELGTRFDGGPTSWQAVILTADPDSSYREFNVQIADFTLAYQADNQGFPDPDAAINPPGRVEVGLPFLLAPPPQCPNGDPPPCPELVSAEDPGMMVVNYRNEPIALRVRDPDTNTQASELVGSGDLALAFSSGVFREDPDMNVQPDFYPPLTNDLLPRDPFTPMFRAFEGDRIQVRTLIGAHEEGHNFSIHGNRWLFEPSYPNSGYRNNQMMGISEHFELVVPFVPSLQQKNTVDFLYGGSSVDDLWTGMWGIMRAYRNNAKTLQVLPSNPDAKFNFPNKQDFDGVCPKTAPVRTFNVTAVLAQDVLPNGRLVYNERAVNGGPLFDPTAILYVRTADVVMQGQDPVGLAAGAPVEPLILRANAGDCIELTLTNELPNFGTPLPELDGFSTLPMIIDEFNANQVVPSRRAGLHAQLVTYDIDEDDGAVIGQNTDNLVNPGQSHTYQWYAGIQKMAPNGDIVGVPVEFGATNLISSDRIQHSNKGAIGALVIEPENATWTTDSLTRAAATVSTGGEDFREFVLLLQNDINLRCDGCGVGPGEPGAGPAADADAVPNTAEAEDPEDSGQKAFNYRTEPFWLRMGFDPDTPLTDTRNEDFTNVLTNAQVGGDPETPVFTAEAGEAVRFRILEPAGHQRNSAIQVHGHVFQHLPYINESTELGNNPLSEWKGVRAGLGPGNHFDYLLLDGAGGSFRIPGDYLYRDQQSFNFDGGLWGIFRVEPAP